MSDPLKKLSDEGQKQPSNSLEVHLQFAAD